MAVRRGCARMIGPSVCRLYGQVDGQAIEELLRFVKASSSEAGVPHDFALS